jgi:nucleoside-diphosphate-sugar epimerase
VKILVTGAAGFIGSRLVDRLLAERHDVIAMIRREHPIRPLRDRGATVITGDVRDGEAVARAVRGAEVVYHLARAKGHGHSPAAEVESINVGGTGSVAKASAIAGARLLVHCSSAAVYGSRHPGQPIKEDEALHPDSAYARSKAAAEGLALAHAREGFAVTIARITAVLGPECRSWVPLMRSIGRRRLPIIGAGANWHHPGDVDDIVDGLVFCGTRGSQSAVYNLAGPEPVSLRELILHIAAELGAGPPRSIPGAPVDWYLRLNRALEAFTGRDLPSVAGARFLTSDRRLDLTRANHELGYQPKIGVRDAVRRTADWYRQQGLLDNR